MSQPFTTPLIARLKTWAKAIKRDIAALWLAARDPRVPWHVKAVSGLVAAYALSPIDLIPDFIPILGYLDDLLIVPAGIALAVKLIPSDLMAELRARARRSAQPPSLWGAAFVVAAWFAFLLGAAMLWAAQKS